MGVRRGRMNDKSITLSYKTWDKLSVLFGLCIPIGGYLYAWTTEYSTIGAILLGLAFGCPFCFFQSLLQVKAIEDAERFK